MPYVESKTTIKGDGAKIYDIIKDMAAYPNLCMTGKRRNYGAR